MSFVMAAPEMMAAVAADVANIGLIISAANAAAVVPTTEMQVAANDEISLAVAAVFSEHARAYQELSWQAARFCDQFVQALAAGASAYASGEAVNAQLTQLSSVTDPIRTLTGRPLIGNGADGGTVDGVG
ncbi:PE family protein, partial [Mycobacterium riyadhense]